MWWKIGENCRASYASGGQQNYKGEVSSEMERKVKKKICFFSGDITRNGGTERVTLLIIQKLKELGKYDISILSIVEQRTQPFFDIQDEIKRTKLDNGTEWIAPGLKYIPLVPRLHRFLKNNKIDILIDVDVILDLLSVPASVGLKTKIIAWEHFNYNYIWPSKTYQKFRQVTQWFSARSADFIVTLTKKDQENYGNRLGRRKAIQTIHNPMMLVKQSEKVLMREKSIITVGRLTWVKGIDLLGKLIPTVLKKYPDWKWYVLGEGEERPRLEAAQNELPMVSFDIQTGPSEIIEDGKNVFLIPPFSLDNMREIIEYLIQHDEVRKMFSKNTQYIQERFDVH